MPEFPPSLLAGWTGGAWRGPSPGPLAGFGIDSRAIGPGELFVAVRTAARDGHAFVGAAAQSGAGGALVSRFNPEITIPQLVVDDPVEALQLMALRHREAFTGTVVGVTGSAGKTSTKDLLTLALGGRGRTLATEGNLNNLLGVPLTLLGLDPVSHRFAVIEAGISECGEMDRLGAMIQPDIAVITSVGAAHLELLGTVENVGREKALLLKHLRGSGRAFFPVDCLERTALQDLDCPCTVIGPEGKGSAAPGKSFLYRVGLDRSSQRISVKTPDGTGIQFSLRSTSPGMASNAVLALAVAVELGESAEEAAGRLAHWRPFALRGEIIERASQFIYLDCYNANPVSMLDSARAFAGLVDAGRSRLYVLGSMEELGVRSAELHVGVGRGWPVRRQDRFVLIGEHGEAIRSGLLEAGAGPDSILVAENHGEIRTLLNEWSGAIFLKGSRCHHLEDLVEPTSPNRIEKEAAC